MASVTNLLFVIFLHASLFLPSTCDPQPIAVATTHSIISTWTTSSTWTGSPVCATGGSDFEMDPPTATRLAELFCEDLAKPGNFPAQNASFDSTHYPTDLSIEPYSPNYTEIELSGLFTRGSLLRAYSWVDDSGVLYIQGTDEQCARDNCTAGLEGTIGRCEWNSHYVGGSSVFMTDCGVYMLFIGNCSGNWWDHSCDKWHEMHPDVGLNRSESFSSLGMPDPLLSSTTSAATASLPTASATTTVSPGESVTITLSSLKPVG
ncbi:hypothetical protein HRR83_002425 [Exophiala dermatitidis]|uniref:Uncharacterized protein n=1 Tax=Exophiala dermatitidis TaxID=5970 RepID=A0AAN6EZ05_EXODE|nr:hypothetical protein HRR74_002503 [Exophiala dermatitidis]KAJ4525422.1 hypothetical protein HRR73_002152 [Exophiala dermatitidis]KAJ4536737.1 hypothetical protein HRR76_004764 [Exophiala dermatitidis]KAJ4555660.1 hypothetical protein HRR77_001589 [Exophiala dermatitidis]KAJ4568963.1 hypothetical protein HRR81_006620 [Exophiala dermatitidis]